MTFGEKLRKLRDEKGMTQEDLANQLYVSRTAVSKWETNKGYPSIDTIVSIQGVFGVSLDYLIGEEDVDEGLEMRRRRSKRFYWLAIGCFGLALAFTMASVVVYGNGFVEWMLPLRLCGVMAVIGYIVLASVSTKLYRTPEQNRVNWKRILVSRYIVAVIVGAVLLGVIIGMT